MKNIFFCLIFKLVVIFLEFKIGEMRVLFKNYCCNKCLIKYFIYINFFFKENEWIISWGVNIFCKYLVIFIKKFKLNVVY